MALSIGAAVVLLAGASYEALSCSHSRTSWVVPVELCSSRLVVAHSTGSLAVQVCRVLAV